MNKMFLENMAILIRILIHFDFDFNFNFGDEPNILSVLFLFWKHGECAIARLSRELFREERSDNLLR